MKSTPRSAWLLLAIMVALATVVRLMTSQRTRLEATSPSGDAEPAASKSTSSATESIPAADTRSERTVGGRSGRGTRSVGFAVATALMVALMGAGAVLAADEAPDFTVAHNAAHPDGNTNDASFWEKYLADNYGGTWVCEKFELTTDPVVLAADADALIIKAGQWNYGWVPAPAGSYSPPENSTSHYFICDSDTPVEDDVIEPDGDILGPCADPAYYAFFDNTASTVALKFKFVWYNNLGKNVITKIVPAGSTYTTWQHWVKPFTEMKVGYKDPNTGIWINLVKETSVKGRYPVCPYSPGFSTPTP
jgi:hypothetical protein